MHHAYTLLVMASIVASAPTYASGSCLSYGHSCWGAHGKRSGTEDTRWIISKLAPLPIKLQNRQNMAQLLQEEQNRKRVSEQDFIVSNEQDSGRGDDLVARSPVIIMEQPPRLYDIMNQLQRNIEENSLN